jgi:DMSO/TMAO reductase YedYZ molybdopterin-dependent catalytic subunit
MADIKALPSISGYAGLMSSTGNISGPVTAKGVALTEFLKAVGSFTENNGVRVTAKDGYTMTLSYSQITTGNFTVYDSNTGKETTPTNTPVPFLSYEENGKPLGDDVGPLRLEIMTCNNQVIDGHWCVKWVQNIEVISVEKPWTLALQGAVNLDIDPATFESCSAIGCHGASWTDNQGHVWAGVPLWDLVGKIDDVPVISQGDNFNDALADQGYTVKLTASNGNTLNLSSAEVKRNDKLIVAFRCDGVPLPDDQWPLRLVGPNLEQSKMIGQITSISVNTATTPVTTAAVVLTVKGTQTKTYTLDQLKALTPTSGYGGTKNNAGTITAPVPYKGVALSDLLNAVGGIKSTDSVKLTASDGFTKTLTYAQVTGSGFNFFDLAGNAVTSAPLATLLLAYETNGQALDISTGPVECLVLTGQNLVTNSSNFVKMVMTVEIIPVGTASTTVPPTTTSTVPPTTTSTTPTGSVILTVKGSQTKTYTLDQLKALPTTIGYGGTKNNAGTITAPVPYTGVALSDLLTAAGGIKSTDSVKLTASDGFTKTLTYAQVTGSGFNFFDLAGNAVTSAPAATLILAYETNGQTLGTGIGPVEFIVLNSQNLVTNSSNFVKMVITIEIIAAS